VTHHRRIWLLLTAFVLAASGQGTAYADGAAPVLPTIPVQGSTAPIPTAFGLNEALGSLMNRPALGDSALWIGDPATNATLLASNATSALSPASTLKLLTAATALRQLGATTRLATRVVVDGSTLTLIGGGDATLPSRGRTVSLAALANKTSAQLPAGPLKLVYDISLFGGRTLGAGWSRSFPAAGVVAPVQALMVDQGRASPHGSTRVSDPARHAADAFADLLRAEGAQIASVSKGKASDQAREIARVESAPVQQLVHHMLTDSDNDLAESLAHLAGAKQTGVGSFASGAQAMTRMAAELGLPTEGIELSDGSGLSSRDRIAAQTLGGILMLAAQGSFSGLAPALAIAGFTGTLADRFTSGRQTAAAGYVRAKTGTLSDVATLAGMVPDVDGRVLVFAVMANDVPSLSRARAVIDQLATRLRACGCSGAGV